jgi:hypothetical protein
MSVFRNVTRCSLVQNYTKRFSGTGFLHFSTLKMVVAYSFQIVATSLPLYMASYPTKQNSSHSTQRTPLQISKQFIILSSIP